MLMCAGVGRQTAHVHRLKKHLKQVVTESASTDIRTRRGTGQSGQHETQIGREHYSIRFQGTDTCRVHALLRPGGYLGRRINCESELGLLAIVDAQAFQ